uniref:Uncharacterized protein n=1 Tax=Chromera velia CCMP2878 TaxID=1169474 RepID=A0A0G4HYD7_9ALVE|eukprot:Cvel_33561.t1-p1 / transcript=Cvel_33561.t1 / gene=Cvel_33561 / organism=Chromera_velia_CCMP2878 / gene_product=hypothetical protein / transcript_product=hypothetical protein / location=Cvel_scaffold5482:3274-3543(+) / protein_length=90 / sequence_SO=supercontig / SO=protein_coding / is_pseudo=false
MGLVSIDDIASLLKIPAQTWILIKIYISVTSWVSEKAAEMAKKKADSLQQGGHSKACADTHALRQLGLLDSECDLELIIKQAGGCSKFGI